MVGENASTNTPGHGPRGRRAEVPLISPSSTNPRVTSEGGPYAFRVCFTDTFQGRLLAGYARETAEAAERVGVLVDAKSDYSIGLARVFAERFAALGGTVRRGVLRPGRHRLPRSAHPGSSPSGPTGSSSPATTATSARWRGRPASWGSASRSSAATGGTRVDGWRRWPARRWRARSTRRTSPPDNPGTRVQQFIARYQARFGHPPDALGALGYDAARVGMEALRRSGGVGGPHAPRADRPDPRLRRQSPAASPSARTATR